MANCVSDVFELNLNHPQPRCRECKTQFTPLYHNQRFCLSEECRRIHLRKIKQKSRQKKAANLPHIEEIHV